MPAPLSTIVCRDGIDENAFKNNVKRLPAVSNIISNADKSAYLIVLGAPICLSNLAINISFVNHYTTLTP